MAAHPMDATHCRAYSVRMTRGQDRSATQKGAPPLNHGGSKQAEQIWWLCRSGEQGGRTWAAIHNASISFWLNGYKDISRTFPAKESDPIDEFGRVLFARVTETVISHETEDWPSYYDRLCALVCRVIAQSGLRARSEKWWHRLKPE
jgi:hypothetical protein